MRDEHLLADLKAAMLGQVAGHEVGSAGRDRRAQYQAVSRRKHTQQVIERRADVAHVDLDVRERRRPERDHYVPRARAVGHALAQRHLPVRSDAIEQLLGPRLRERHPALAHRLQASRVAVDSEHLEPAVGEGQRQREPNATKADYRHVGGALRPRHPTPEVSLH